MIYPIINIMYYHISYHIYYDIIRHCAEHCFKWNKDKNLKRTRDKVLISFLNADVNISSLEAFGTP